MLVHNVLNFKSCAANTVEKLQQVIHAQIVDLLVLHNFCDTMAKVIIEMKVMPVSPDTDLTKLTHDAEKVVVACDAKVHQHKIEPVAFGLKAVILTIVVDEEKGSTDAMEEKLAALHHVESVLVTSVSRALG